MSGQQQLITFYIEELLFGLDTTDVLLVGHDIKAIKPLAVEQGGLFGTIKLESKVLPVLDFAHYMGLRSATDEKKCLLNQIEMVQQGYQDWFQELERKINKGQHITNGELNLNTNLLNWDTKIILRDNDLKSLIKTLAKPKAAFLGCCEKLVTLTSQEQWEQAESLLEQQKMQGLLPINSVLTNAKTHMETNVRQVLIYLTKESKTPYLALLIDQINDVLSYPNTGFKSYASNPMDEPKLDKQKLNGIYMSEGLPDCHHFTLDTLLLAERQLESA
jgi:chemotaxis signal transduction protein